VSQALTRVRIGPKSWLSRLWARLFTPRVWPVCARCGLVRDEGYGPRRLPRGTKEVCRGTMESWSKGGERFCVQLGVRLG
jgi:hypothetical protein